MRQMFKIFRRKTEAEKAEIREKRKKEKEKRALLAHAHKYRNIDRGIITVAKPDYPKPKVKKPEKDLNTCDEEPLYDEYKKAYMRDLDTLIFTQKVEELIRSMQKDVDKLREEDLIGKYCLVCKVLFPKDTDVCPDCSIALRPVYKGRSR